MLQEPLAGDQAVERFDQMVEKTRPDPFYHLNMTTEPTELACLACRRSKQDTPLIRLEYGDAHYWICPQHLPLLIHDPGRLVGLLPGAERLSPAEHHD